MNKQQAIVFFGIILAGLGISLFTLNHFGKKVEVAENDPAPAPPFQNEPAEPEPPAPKPKAEPKKSEPAPAPAPSGEMTFKSPEALMGALVDKIKNRDVNGFVAMAGEGTISPAIRPQVEGLLKDPAWAPNPETPISELVKSPDSVRWAIHFGRAPGATPSTAVNPASADAATTELYADVVSSPDKSSWTVKKIALPFDFAAKTGMKPGNMPMPPGESNPARTAPAPGATPSTGPAPMPTPAGPVDATDALTVAFAFSKAVIDRNFELARSLTDQNRVTDERVAALLIAVEEGTFHLREDKPLVVTLSRDDLTWVLTRVDSGSASSEFAVEMGKPAADGNWMIHGLTFSKLIAALAEQAGAGGVAYAPIVADPQGGDSLVLYFEFDEDKVSTRTARQLRIVADILKKDPTRKLHINGHADALGTDGYNEGLSNRRAAAIRENLIESGVAADQVVTKAFGEAMPRRPNFNPDGTDNPGNRSQNRRAEVYLDF